MILIPMSYEYINGTETAITKKSYDLPHPAGGTIYDERLGAR
jgi:hypothetical protein